MRETMLSIASLMRKALNLQMLRIRQSRYMHLGWYLFVTKVVSLRSIAYRSIKAEIKI